MAATRICPRRASAYRRPTESDQSQCDSAAAGAGGSLDPTQRPRLGPGRFPPHDGQQYIFGHKLYYVRLGQLSRDDWISGEMRIMVRQAAAGSGGGQYQLLAFRLW